MDADFVEPDTPDGARAESIHPPIRSILDALSFRLARLTAVNDFVGSAVFRKEYGLSLNEWRILGLTTALEPVAFHTIRDILLMDKGQLSRVIKELVSRGIITTQSVPNDARSIELRTTPAGRALHDEVLKFAAKRNEMVVGSLTRAECEEFLRLLQKITAHSEHLSTLSGYLK